jgi:hypothetical protein
VDPGVPESISPELALVDPALRQAELSWLAAERRRLAVAKLAAAPAAQRARGPAPTHPPRVWSTPSLQWTGLESLRGRMLRTLLSLSLLANGLLAAVVVTRHLWQGSSVATPAAVTVTVRSPTRPPGAAAAPRLPARVAPHAGRATTPITHTTVERRILAVLVKSPRHRLPPRLIDSATGLAKSNLQAACRSTSSRSFLCIVRPAEHKPGEGARVRYRLSASGRATLTWYPYRNS